MTGPEAPRDPAAEPPRLVVSDLDGTLLRSDGTVSDRTRAALRLARDSGATVLFASGRPPRWMMPVANETGVFGPVICSNGALLFDTSTRSWLRERLLASDVGRQLVSEIAEAFPSALFSVELDHEFRYEAELPVPRASPDAAVRFSMVDRSELFGSQPVLKLLARAEGQSADVLLAKAREITGNRAEITHSGGRCLIEIAAYGVTKAAMLAEYCAEREIARHEVVAFGDMPNDLEMLDWAGSAYAPEGAHPDVRAAVSDVCPANNDDGVATVLERLFHR